MAVKFSTMKSEIFCGVASGSPTDRLARTETISAMEEAILKRAYATATHLAKGMFCPRTVRKVSKIVVKRIASIVSNKKTKAISDDVCVKERPDNINKR